MAIMLGFSRKPQATAAAVGVASDMLRFTVHHPAGGPDEWATPDHVLLQEKWEWYVGSQYNKMKYDWNGGQFGESNLARVLVPRAKYVPPGFTTAGPVQSERRPSFPQRVVPQVVNRWSGLLFGEGMSPLIKCVGDEKTGHWLQSFAKTSRLFPKMLEARDIGGAEGAVAIGLKVVGGTPRFEIFDPRYTKQIWEDREAGVLAALDIRYKIRVFVPRLRGGQREEAFYWQRRLITKEDDIVYKPVWVRQREAARLENGVEVQANDRMGDPDWDRLVDETKSVKHDLGFCPVRWIKNRPNHESEYGLSDCDGLYEQAYDIDQLRAAISSNIKANMDPTLVITNETGKMPDIRKGTGNGLAIQAPGTASYLEASFSSITVAISWFEKVIDQFFREAECLELTKEGGLPPTATEIRQRIGPQLTRTGRLREQYGQLGVLPVLKMAVEMERVLQTRGQGMTGLEPRVTKVTEGEDEVQPVELGPGGYIEVDWPPMTRPTIADVAQAATAAASAKQGGVMPEETVVRWLAPYFGADDIGVILAKLKQDQEKAAQAQMGQPIGNADENSPEQNY